MIKYRASKLTLKQIEQPEEKKFLNENHYQGYCSSSWCYGLYDNDELLCLMSFRKPRYNKRFNWELLRLASKQGCTIHGGASRLLKCFMSEYPEDSILSYCNRDKFSGDVYHKLGFTSLGITRGYHYEKDGKRYHRSSFQKWKCLEMWPRYIGKSVTEGQIMKEQGYTRVDDEIGQETFVINDIKRWYIYEITLDDYHYIGQKGYLHDKTEQELLEDNYFGSGTLIRRFQKSKGSVGKKKMLYINITNQEDANKLEIQEIAKSRELYGKLNESGFNLNIKEGGQGYSFSSKSRGPLTEEQRKKLSERMKRVWSSEEFRKKFSEARRESHPRVSSKVRQDRSNCLTNYNKSDKHRAKVVEMNHARKGVFKHSEESKRKTSETLKSKPHTSPGSRGMSWYTDGFSNTLAFRCPEGFRPGRTKKKKN